MPRESAGSPERKPELTDSVTENIPSRLGGIRVKWRGKSPPDPA